MSITQEASTTSSRGNQEKNLGSRSTLPRSVDATRVGFATTVDPANRYLLTVPCATYTTSKHISEPQFGETKKGLYADRI